jgi:hypothetical protein
VDRSGAYAARWVAKSLVKAGLAKRVLVQVAYAIGVAKVRVLIALFFFAYSLLVPRRSRCPCTWTRTARAPSRTPRFCPL